MGKTYILELAGRAIAQKFRQARFLGRCQVRQFGRCLPAAAAAQIHQDHHRADNVERGLLPCITVSKSLRRPATDAPRPKSERQHETVSLTGFCRWD